VNNREKELVIISILGTGERSEVEYRWKDQTSKKTTIFLSALRGWYPEAQIFALATEEAKRQERYVKESVGGPLEFVRISEGRDEGEFSELYRVLVETVPDDARVVFDITHGYRSLPLLVLLALGYLREAKGVRVEHILYGAERAANGGVVPVIDLAPFQGMWDWAHAANRFIDTGDARLFARVMREQVLPGEEDDRFEELAEALESLSHELLANNLVEAGRQAKRLIVALKNVRPSDERPYALLTKRLERQITPMAFEYGVDSEKRIIESLLYIATWYFKHGYVEKSAALLAEWIFLFGKYTHNPPKPLSDNKFGAADLSPELRQAHDDIKGLRNALMHMSIGVIRGKDQETEFPEARVCTKKVLKKLLELARKHGLEVAALL